MYILVDYRILYYLLFIFKHRLARFFLLIFFFYSRYVTRIYSLLKITIVGIYYEHNVQLQSF